MVEIQCSIIPVLLSVHEEWFFHFTIFETEMILFGFFWSFTNLEFLICLFWNYIALTTETILRNLLFFSCWAMITWNSFWRKMNSNVFKILFHIKQHKALNCTGCLLKYSIQLLKSVVQQIFQYHREILYCPYSASLFPLRFAS